jgi:hypothetical protein
MIEIPEVSLVAAMSAIGVFAGTAACLLGVAQLTCEHGSSPWAPRISTVLLSMIAGYTAIDSWEVWAGVDEPLDAKAVAFCIALALSWGYRRTFGWTSHRHPRSPG